MYLAVYSTSSFKLASMAACTESNWVFQIALFAWNLSTINPSTVDNSVNIPSDMGTNAKDA